MAFMIWNIMGLKYPEAQFLAKEIIHGKRIDVFPLQESEKNVQAIRDFFSDDLMNEKLTIMVYLNNQTMLIVKSV